MWNRGVSAALIVQFCANMSINLVETGRRTEWTYLVALIQVPNLIRLSHCYSWSMAWVEMLVAGWIANSTDRWVLTVKENTPHDDHNLQPFCFGTFV